MNKTCLSMSLRALRVPVRPFCGPSVRPCRPPGSDLKFFTHEPVPIDPATLPEGEEAQANVVVVGGGASGLAAAAAALESGARVIVLEKAPHTGGSAALSAGIVTAASTDIQKASGLPADSAGLAKLWLEDQKRSVKGAPANLPDAAQVEALVKQSAETVDWLTKGRHAVLRQCRRC